MCRCATKKKNPKKSFFWPTAIFYLGHKTLNVFKQLHINDGTLYLNTISYNIFKRACLL